jgi:hydroxymethylpyrimidine/phosphomethylpyrimidine kinase
MEIRELKNYLKEMYLITPNIPEVELLSGRPVSNVEQMKQAAQTIHKDWGVQNIYIKGGHLEQATPVDLLYANGHIHTFKSEAIPFNIHGSGSFVNAAIAAYMFQGDSLVSAITRAQGLFLKAAKNASAENPVISFL